MNLDQLRAFLALSEELHFGRTAERLYLSQPRVSRLVAALEAEVGGSLFERTSRRVRLTSLGAQLREELLPGYRQMQCALAHARAAAREPAGLLRVGCTITTEGPAFTALIAAYESAHPASEVRVQQVPIADPYAALRGGEVDVLVNWLAVDEPDLAVGPAIDHQRRVLAVSSRHPLACRLTVCLEDLAGMATIDMPSTFPPALLDALIPPQTPSGRAVPRTRLVREMAETQSLVARGLVVHPTVESMAGKLLRDDIVLVPITDLPPMPLGLIWRIAHENARIRALADVARRQHDPGRRNDTLGGPGTLASGSVRSEYVAAGRPGEFGLGGNEAITRS